MEKRKKKKLTLTWKILPVIFHRKLTQTGKLRCRFFFGEFAENQSRSLYGVLSFYGNTLSAAIKLFMPYMIFSQLGATSVEQQYQSQLNLTY